METKFEMTVEIEGDKSHSPSQHDEPVPDDLDLYGTPVNFPSLPPIERAKMTVDLFNNSRREFERPRRLIAVREILIDTIFEAQA